MMVKAQASLNRERSPFPCFRGTVCVSGTHKSFARTCVLITTPIVPNLLNWRVVSPSWNQTGRFKRTQPCFPSQRDKFGQSSAFFRHRRVFVPGRKITLAAQTEWHLFFSQLFSKTTPWSSTVCTASETGRSFDEQEEPNAIHDCA